MTGGISQEAYRTYREIHRQLSDSIREELDAASRYQRRRAYARAAGYHEVAKLYDHISGEEKHHSEEFLKASHKLKPKRE